MIDKKKCNQKIQWSIENIVMFVIKYLEIIQILALTDPQELDMPLNK